MAIGKPWHKACFKCNECNATIPLGGEVSHEGLLFCKRCHQANFGTGGYGFGQGGTLSSHKWNTQVLSGAPTQPEVVVQKPAAGGAANFCQECGSKAAGGSFCPNCGTRIEA